METLTKSTLLFLAGVFIAGCGVKGAPLPPLTPPPLGRGEPTYSDTTRKSKQKTRPLIQDEESQNSSGGE
ncbi:hypothetical protein B9G69_007975 [Bdellovibrio sp. SKB1291214]|uniref:hypothetical protein n=1 Tax=Bdellovibrio sp. SKB1291214 TaxID=1732569 RepID=UPI000B517A52|nr:hypothetical protein [Bdellovibrio sp. SKB1291214]UYL10511.1 hypothetical protein B9G69_007975 [Bdellovibrio sp. SKB1291214]